jgi:hypothetical protein
LHDITKVVIAGSPEANDPSLAALLSNWARTCKRLNTFGVWEALSVVTKLGQQGWRQNVACSW